MLETPIIVMLVLLAIVAVLWWVYQSLYTEAADRRRLALEAMAKVQGASAEQNEIATSIPSPNPKVRELNRKAE